MTYWSSASIDKLERLVRVLERNVGLLESPQHELSLEKIDTYRGIALWVSELRPGLAIHTAPSGLARIFLPRGPNTDRELGSSDIAHSLVYTSEFYVLPVLDANSVLYDIRVYVCDAVPEDCVWLMPDIRRGFQNLLRRLQ